MAASALQIEANRANAHLSTGPRSATGKEVSSKNAQKHNLTGGTAFLEGENREEYDEHLLKYFRQFKPLAEHDIHFTVEMADAKWRLNRARRMEIEILTDNPNPFDDPRLDRLTRYIASIERTYYKAYNELKKINAERNKAELIPAMRYDIHGSYTHQPINAWEIMRARNAEKPQGQNEPKPAMIMKT